ncbi:venom acid phosphatase Acph-1-like [Pseudomyrmex gracilis]|uniref:venom acid phosphatase Acph-1-like n=1 Tax=Pseudomyrmex gracilis TaxID=219809 RepID=UPI0009949A0B|nr:venom acid phosphatase Acph-1-like [Pseudomyrmex gracilis]
MDGKLYFACIAFVFCICAVPSLGISELKLVHVLFAHKLYAPEQDDVEKNETSIPQILSYEHFISVETTMPESAYLNLYNLGVYLRETYNEFLGDTYMSKTVKTRTTEFVPSILSSQLVNAGLWPPLGNQTWNENLNWQPIPSDYLELKEDTLLLGSLCPKFISQMNEVLQTDEMRKTMAPYQSLFDHLSRYTKRNISTPSDVAALYATLETMADRKKILPHWANDVFPDGTMSNVTLLEYDLLSATPLQRQLNGGTLLAEIIGNSLKYERGDISRERKMMLYSGDARNIVGVLKNLDFWSPHIPEEAAALIFELHLDNDTGAYGMKTNYYTGVDGTTISLLLPNCHRTEICPLQTLIHNTFATIPENPHSLCGWFVEAAIQTETQSEESKPSDSSNNSGSTLHRETNVMFTLMLIYFTARSSFLR